MNGNRVEQKTETSLNWKGCARRVECARLWGRIGDFVTKVLTLASFVRHFLSLLYTQTLVLIDLFLVYNV